MTETLYIMENALLNTGCKCRRQRLNFMLSGVLNAERVPQRHRSFCLEEKIRPQQVLSGRTVSYERKDISQRSFPRKNNRNPKKALYYKYAVHIIP